jgi:sporulation protein YlmC with PRC-barrel domain
MLTEEKGCLRRCILMCIVILIWYLPLSIPAMAADAERMNPENSFQAEQANPQQMIRASETVGQPVYNERGEEIGEVEDLIMSRNGKIKKVILSVGEFLQTGEKLLAVPFRSLKRSNEDHIVYNATKEQLERDPRFSYWTEGLYGRPFYPFPPYGVGWGYQAPSAAFGEKSVPFPREGKYRGEFRPWGWEYSPERLRVSALLDQGILNNTGEEVADLDDLMISLEGKVEQIILDVGGFFGMPEKLASVSYRPLKVTDLGIVYNITKEQIQVSPAFSYEKR